MESDREPTKIPISEFQEGNPVPVTTIMIFVVNHMREYLPMIETGRLAA
jgi:hypothetical protein